jgi:hypothetical protein
MDRELGFSGAADFGFVWFDRFHLLDLIGRTVHEIWVAGKSENVAGRKLLVAGSLSHSQKHSTSNIDGGILSFKFRWGETPSSPNIRFGSLITITRLDRARRESRPTNQLRCAVCRPRFDIAG